MHLTQDKGYNLSHSLPVIFGRRSMQVYEMVREIGEYVLSFLNNWFFWIGLVTLIGDLLEKHVPLAKKHVGRWASQWLFVSLTVICFFLAGFQAWREEHEKVKSQAVYMIAEPAILVDNSTNVPLPIGQPIQANVFWKTWGQAPARGIASYLICYIRPDYSDKTQDEVIADFKNRWGTIMKNYESDKRDLPDLFPGNDRAFRTCKPESDDKISSDTRDDLKFGRKVLFVVGAERFYDSSGEQESHTCLFMENNPQSPSDFGAVAFHKCHTYTTQVSN